MFSTATLSRITEELRLAREEVTSLEKQTEQARASVAEWTRLLDFAESTSGPVAASGDQLVAEQPRERCACGLPGVPETAHGIGACVPMGKGYTYTELMGQAEEQVRGVFEPYRPGGQA